MNLPVVAEVRDELAASNVLMDKNLGPWPLEVVCFFRDMENDLHWRMLPQVTALVYRGLKVGFRCTVYMVTIFRLAYLANHIHDMVGDDEEGQGYDGRLQFNILIGDYLFGRVLKLLSENDSQYLARTFAEMIMEINEGRVIRKMKGGNKKDLEVIAKEKATLYKNAFLTASMVANLPAAEQLIYREVGNKLGLALGVEYEKLRHVSSLSYLEEAGDLLLLTSDDFKDELRLIDRLVNEVWNYTWQLRAISKSDSGGGVPAQVF
ncbi:MAG: hypothetical protein HPY90_01775 [Syntrophothermus sp.]|uniref:hypothetical protein n=1 Tax=Syntrophothermus sp. TaxID=2736299 RepID=UPI00257EF926|nr:hypothetical protein [Syntrophothermus sp.]NSW81991.1 hypothetical protein [Syntrophothermus sp.]